MFRRFFQELDSQINNQSGDSEYISGSGCTHDESESDESNVSVNISSSRPLFASTPNTQSSSAVCGEKRMQECQLENQQEINLSPKEITEFSSDGQKLWLLISKIGKREEEIRDLRSDVMTIVEKIPKPPNYAETVTRCQGSCPCQPVSSPWRVDIASVSG